MKKRGDSYENLKEFDNHKMVIFLYDPKSKLKGFIAIHNNNLGPAVGGTRMFPYSSQKEALSDVLRLSRAMTYKCALAGVKYGGGKGVIIGDSDKTKTDDLLRGYAKEIYKLDGRFYTGEDVGISENDVQFMLQSSPFFIGKKGLAGDPSPYAALSTFFSIQTVSKEVFGSMDLDNRKIGVKGVGKVGGELVRLLTEAGAKVYIADINPKAVKKIKKNYRGVKVIDPKEIHKQKMDVYAPCAMGNEFTTKTIKEINTTIICGAANNQLRSKKIGELLHRQGVLYVPDYVVNSGGLINVVDELEEGSYSEKRVRSRIEGVKKTVQMIIKLSQEEKQSPANVADRLAERIIND